MSLEDARQGQAVLTQVADKVEHGNARQQHPIGQQRAGKGQIPVSTLGDFQSVFLLHNYSELRNGVGLQDATGFRLRR